MFPPLIALYSPGASHGKTETAKILVAEYGYLPVKMAGPLKAMLRTFLLEASVAPEMVDRYIEGDLKEAVVPEVGVTSRHLMQSLGTEWGRDCIKPDLWASMAITRIRSLLKAGKRVVVDDMRFREEYHALSLLSARMIKVTRISKLIESQTTKAGHRSEGGLADLDFQHHIKNDGTINELVGTVTTLMDRYLGINP